MHSTQYTGRHSEGMIMAEGTMRSVGKRVKAKDNSNPKVIRIKWPMEMVKRSGRGLRARPLALLKGDLCAEKGVELENQKKDQKEGVSRS